jgi:acyl-coenzyme A thioesterase PaaI-like protein
MHTNHIDNIGNVKAHLCRVLRRRWTEHAGACSRSLQPVSDEATNVSDQPTNATPAGADGGAGGDADDGSDAATRPTGPHAIDGVSRFMGLRWEDPQTVRVQIRPELINGGGLLSGVATYAMVDYCMGSTLWAQTTREERIATIGIAINYVQTATEGEIVCRTTLDRRNRTTAVMRSEVRHADGRLLVTAIGSYTIFPTRTAEGTGKRPARISER